MTPPSPSTKDVILAELNITRTTFHALLDSLSKEDLQKQSLNPGWTNGEILAHMVFGFIVVYALLPMTRFAGFLPKSASKPLVWVLNAATGPFNWVNMLGARGQGKVYTYERLPKIYDWVHFRLVKQIGSIKEGEWQRGMHFPTKWDSNFQDFMTLEQQFHYPVIHFDFHLTQIAR